MQYAFSNHARNDRSLGWLGVNKHKLETGLCFSWTACSQETGNQDLNGFVCRCSHLVFGLLLCFVSATGLQGRVTGDGAYRCGLQEERRALRNINTAEERDEKQADDDSWVLISPNFIRFIRSTFASLFNNFYLCAVGCYGDCEVTKCLLRAV